MLELGAPKAGVVVLSDPKVVAAGLAVKVLVEPKAGGAVLGMPKPVDAAVAFEKV